MGDACHPGPSFLYFGIVRFSGSQEDMPTTVVDAVDEVDQAKEEESTVAQSDTETVPNAGDSGEAARCSRALSKGFGSSLD